MKLKLFVNSILAMFLAVGLFSCDAGSANADSSKEGKTSNNAAHDGLHIGDTAPDFNLKNTKGEMVSLKGFENAKGYIVTFTCNHCPYSVMYEDRLIELHKEMSAKGYPVIAINPNDPEVEPKDSFENMVARANEKSFNFEYLFDEGQKVYPKYGATKTPHVFLLDKDLKVRYIGAIDDSARNASKVEQSYVKMAIEALENGKDPNPSTTKAIGCSVKKKA